MREKALDSGTVNFQLLVLKIELFSRRIQGLHLAYRRREEIKHTSF